MSEGRSFSDLPRTFQQQQREEAARKWVRLDLDSPKAAYMLGVLACRDDDEMVRQYQRALALARVQGSHHFIALYAWHLAAHATHLRSPLVPPAAAHALLGEAAAAHAACKGVLPWQWLESQRTMRALGRYGLDAGYRGTLAREARPLEPRCHGR